MISFGDYLKARRLQLGLSQVQLAQRIVMDRRNYIRLEKGSPNPRSRHSYEVLLRLAQALDVPFQDMVRQEAESWLLRFAGNVSPL